MVGVLLFSLKYNCWVVVNDDDWKTKFKITAACTWEYIYWPVGDTEEITDFHCYIILHTGSLPVPECQHKVGEKREGCERGGHNRGNHQVHSVLGWAHLEGELECSPIREYNTSCYSQHHAVTTWYNQTLKHTENKSFYIINKMLIVQNSKKFFFRFWSYI